MAGEVQVQYTKVKAQFKVERVLVDLFKDLGEKPLLFSNRDILFDLDYINRGSESQEKGWTNLIVAHDM